MLDFALMNLSETILTHTCCLKCIRVEECAVVDSLCQKQNKSNHPPTYLSIHQPIHPSIHLSGLKVKAVDQISNISDIPLPSNEFHHFQRTPRHSKANVIPPRRRRFTSGIQFSRSGPEKCLQTEASGKYPNEMSALPKLTLYKPKGEAVHVGSNLQKKRWQLLSCLSLLKDKQKKHHCKLVQTSARGDYSSAT